MGDGALNDPEANTPFFEHFRPFFSCAQQLEAQLRPRAAPVVWFLLSDSKEVRQQAVEEYGDKVLVNLKVRGGVELLGCRWQATSCCMGGLCGSGVCCTLPAVRVSLCQLLPLATMAPDVAS